MKATKVNTMVWTVSAIALAVHATAQGWDAASTIGSIFGYTLICGALWLAVNGLIKERD